MAKQQYVVMKHVMAESAMEAVKKSLRLPVHEVYINNSWFEKVANYEFNRTSSSSVTGFRQKKVIPITP